MDKSLGILISHLEDLFRVFNERFYDGKLEKPIITISPDTTKGAYGWCTGWKAWRETADDNAEGYYEINLCAEHLKRPFEKICETLLHEMVHLHNLWEGVGDTSRSGLYHNKKYKESAEKHGLTVTRSPKYGWCMTDLTAEALSFIKGLDQGQFGFYRMQKPKKKERGFIFAQIRLSRLRLHCQGNKGRERDLRGLRPAV